MTERIDPRPRRRPVVLDVLRVFCGPDGSHGQQLGVVRDGSAVRATPERRALAAGPGEHDQTVFVDDSERGVIDIYDRDRALTFAGRAAVGAAWLLDLEELVTPAGEVFARHDGEFTWITAHARWALPRTLRQYASPAEVDALPVPPPGEGPLYAWAWEDESAGRVRARAFTGSSADGTLAEAEASGDPALVLTCELDRALNIIQGRGSQILTAPGRDGEIEVGGRVRLEQPAVSEPMPLPRPMPMPRRWAEALYPVSSRPRKSVLDA